MTKATVVGHCEGVRRQRARPTHEGLRHRHHDRNYRAIGGLSTFWQKADMRPFGSGGRKHGWGGWEAAVQTSLLTVLVLIMGLAHMSSPREFQRWHLAHDVPSSPQVGDILAEMNIDGTHELADSRVLTNCSFLRSDETPDQICPVTLLSCEHTWENIKLLPGYLSSSSTLKRRLARSSPRPILTYCTDLGAINSATIDSQPLVSACG